MKRLFLILFFFGCLCLFSCQGEYGILGYQRGNVRAECKINGKYTVEILKTEGESRITVLEPKNAEGIVFTVGEGVSLSTGDYEVEMEKEHLKGICALGNIFSQREEHLTAAVQKGENSIFTFQNGECVYQVTLGENNMPKRVLILSESFEYDIEILSVELN